MRALSLAGMQARLCDIRNKRFSTLSSGMRSGARGVLSPTHDFGMQPTALGADDSSRRGI